MAMIPSMILRKNILRLIIIGMLALVSCVVYMYGIDQESIWVDEWYTVRSVKQPSVSESIAMVVDGENTPPAYFLLLREWAGNTPTDLHRLRCFSVMWAVGCVVLIYWLGTMLAGGAAGGISALLVVCSPYVLWYAQEARNSAMAMFVAMALVMVFYQYARRTGLWWLLATACMQLFALYTHYYFVLFIPAQFLYLYMRSTRRKLLYWIGAMVPVGCLFALWIPRMLEQMSINRSNWLLAPNIYFPVQLLSAFSAGIFYELRQPVAIIVTTLFAICFLMGIFMIHINRRGMSCRVRFSDETVLLLLFLCVPIVSAYLISHVKPIMYEGKRYLIVVLPFFYIIAARGIIRIRRRWIALLVTLAIMSCSVLFMTDIYKGTQKRYWRQTAHIIEKNSKPDDALYSIDYTKGGVLDYYGTGYAKKEIIPDFRLFKKHLRPYKRVWFIAYSENTFEEKQLSNALRLIEAKTLVNPAGYKLRLVLYDCSML